MFEIKEPQQRVRVEFEVRVARLAAFMDFWRKPYGAGKVARWERFVPEPMEMTASNGISIARMIVSGDPASVRFTWDAIK